MKETVIKHVEELRKRLIIVIISFSIFFGIVFLFSNQLIELLKNLFITSNVKLIATGPLDFLYTQIKISLFTSLILTFPILLYNTLKFLKPGLKEKERHILTRILPLSIILFIIGIIFCYFLLSRFAIDFLAGLAVKSGVENLWNINIFVSFIITSCLMLGLVFQTPIVLYLVNKLNIINAKELRKKRKYVILIVFIIAAVITPPDVITQLIIAIPLLLMYELTLLMIR